MKGNTYRITASFYAVDVQASCMNEAADRFIEKRYPNTTIQHSLLRDPDDNLATWSVYEWRDGDRGRQSNPVRMARGITIERA